MGDEYFVRETHNDIAWQTEALLARTDKAPMVLVRESTTPAFEGHTEIFVYTKDAQHVFMAVATCLAQLGLNIQDARIYSSANGYTLDTFHVLNQNFEPLGNKPKLFKKISDALLSELSKVGEYSEIAHKITPRQLKQFAIPTRMEISNYLERNCTVVQVISPDRPGLLAKIAEIFMRFGIIMQNAKISTLGERVEDVFFVTDLEGNRLGDAEICSQLQAAICKELDKQVENDHII